MHFLSYLIFRTFIGFFKLIPFPLLYLISDFIRFLLFSVFSYRKTVISKNLEHCFSSYTTAQLKSIAQEAQKNFVDILLETIKGMETDPKLLIPRYQLTNAEDLNQLFDEGQHIILYSQHLNNWEWAPMCLGLQMNHELVGIIKPLSNKYINNYMLASRSGNNVSVVPTYATGRLFQNQAEWKGQKAIVFIADQRPYKSNRAIALEFFGKSALFHLGAAQYATETDFPVYSMDIRRVQRGRYELTATKFAEKASDHTPEELTQIYKNHLEDLIREAPSSWLWTHKRFKESIKY